VDRARQEAAFFSLHGPFRPGAAVGSTIAIGLRSHRDTIARLSGASPVHSFRFALLRDTDDPEAATGPALGPVKDDRQTRGRNVRFHGVPTNNGLFRLRLALGCRWAGSPMNLPNLLTH
jgi:hypothetical protein